MSRWIQLWLLSSEGRSFVEEVASSTSGLYTLSVNKVRNLPILLPPLSELSRAIVLVDQYSSIIEKLETTIELTLKRAERLRQAILDKAFKGELVPQDPNDEPADKLLARIAQIKSTDKKPREKKRMPSKSTGRGRKKPLKRPLLEVITENPEGITPEDLLREANYKIEEVDAFYQELASIMAKVEEIKPIGAQTKTWPEKAQVLLKPQKVKPCVSTDYG
ncbi:hypothetical protein ACFL6U_02975 [Planctomycetota bacterium]